MRKHLLLAVAVIAVLLAAMIASPAGAEKEPKKGNGFPPGCTHLVTAKQARGFTKAVWSEELWRRGVPPKTTLKAYAKKLHCAAGPGHRHAIRELWRKQKDHYFEYRKERKWFAKYRSFEYPDGSHWAVPYPIAWCESGGNYYVGPSGAYGLIPPFPQWMSPKQQDEVAYNLYLDMGESPWAPYEGGCAYR